MPKSKEEQTPEKGLATVTAYCQGLSPLMPNPKTEALLRRLRTGVREAINRDEEPDSIAGKKVPKNGHGEICLPAQYLFSCLVIAGQTVPYQKRKNISTAKSTILPEFFSIASDQLVLVKEEDGQLVPLTDDDWETDERGGNNPGDGTAISIVRPKFPNWGFEVTFEFDEKKIDQSKLVELFRYAGSAVGLCDFRPGKKGTFGRFAVVKWTTVSRRSAESNITFVDLTTKETAEKAA